VENKQQWPVRSRRQSRSLTGPGQAPALSLRAGRNGSFIVSPTNKEFAMSCFCSLTKSALICGIALTVLSCLSLSDATAQTVRGHGKISNGPDVSHSQISVNAGLDANGVAYGNMTWTGDVANNVPYVPGMGGAAEPYIMDVVEIEFDGNNAFVTGVVVNSPQGQYDGIVVQFLFTDNCGLGLPDEIGGQFIEGGNITVTD